MTRKHQTPEYKRNAKVIRSRARTQLKFGTPVRCWRCGGPIMPGMPFDVGHIDPRAGEHMTNLAPEHRHGVGNCRGNRSYGGSMNGRAKQPQRRAGSVQSWPV
jgi:hypothetical protein